MPARSAGSAARSIVRVLAGAPSLLPLGSPGVGGLEHSRAPPLCPRLRLVWGLLPLRAPRVPPLAELACAPVLVAGPVPGSAPALVRAGASCAARAAP